MLLLLLLLLLQVLLQVLLLQVLLLQVLQVLLLQVLLLQAAGSSTYGEWRGLCSAPDNLRIAAMVASCVHRPRWPGKQTPSRVSLHISLGRMRLGALHMLSDRP